MRQRSHNNNNESSLILKFRNHHWPGSLMVTLCVAVTGLLGAGRSVIVHVNACVAPSVPADFIAWSCELERVNSDAWGFVAIGVPLKIKSFTVVSSVQVAIVFAGTSFKMHLIVCPSGQNNAEVITGRLIDAAEGIGFSFYRIFCL